MTIIKSLRDIDTKEAMFGAHFFQLLFLCTNMAPQLISLKQPLIDLLKLYFRNLEVHGRVDTQILHYVWGLSWKDLKELESPQILLCSCDWWLMLGVGWDTHTSLCGHFFPSGSFGFHTVYHSVPKLNAQRDRQENYQSPGNWPCMTSAKLHR